MKIKLKHMPIILSLLAVALGISGTYGSWMYYLGGINDTNSEIDVNIESFDYPTWTVNFYTGGALSGKYGGGRILSSSYTYTSITEEFIFPTNDTVAHPNTTMKFWCTKPYYLFEEDNSCQVFENFSNTRANFSDFLGDIYEPNKSYKVGDISWRSDRTLDLYEIVEENFAYITPDVEKITKSGCGDYSPHINTSFITDVPYPFPHCNLIVSVGGRCYNDEAVKGEVFGLSFLYADLSNGLANNKTHLINEHKMTANALIDEDMTYRLVKPLPSENGTRVTLDSSREWGFVDSSTKTVATYDISDQFKVYISPGMFTYFDVADKEDVVGVYSKPLVATEKHANCTFKHIRIGQVTYNEQYASSYSTSYRFESNKFYSLETPTYMGFRWGETYDTNICECIAHVGGTLDNGSEGNEGGGCLVEGTQILKADGSYTEVENINPGDELLTFDHDLGEFTSSSVIAVAHKEEEAKLTDVTKLTFSNNTELKIANNHALFDLTLNKYAVISKDNAKDYIGHKFYSYENEIVTLFSANTYKDTVKVYVPFTRGNINCIANGLLTNPGVYAKFLMNIFKFEDDMQIDLAKRNMDIEKYGLFTYEDLKDYVNEFVFDELRLKYLKIGLAKKIYSIEEVIANLNIYKKYFD